MGAQRLQSMLFGWWMGVLCQIPAVSKEPAAPSTTSRCHGLWEEGPAGLLGGA